MSFLRQFHNIVSKQSLNTDEKIQALLKFGLEVFDLEIAIVSEVLDSQYTILYVESENPDLAPHCQFDLTGTYCVHTLNADKALSFHHAGNSEISTHPCYQDFQLESYIGAPIRIADRIFGTINFSAAKISPPFTTEHIDYVELFAQWLGFELARRESESKLKSNYKTLEKMEQVASIGSWRIDLPSQQVFWSNETKRIHNLSLEESPTLSQWMRFFSEGIHRDAFSKAISDAINYDLPWALELRATTKQNRTIWVSCHGEAEFHNGECISLIGSLQDITADVELREKLKLQKHEAERLLSERSLLLAKISHEMRTPLNGINGLLLNAMDENDYTKKTEDIQLALRSTEILTGLVNEILDFSKISQEGLSLACQPCDIVPLIDDLVELSKQLVSKKDIQFSHNIKLSESCWVNCDSTRLNQIITNLISNAVKFTDTGAVELNVHSDECSSSLYLFIEVRDTGIGMSSSSISNLFEPFKQGENEVGSHFGGTGLGMSIVKELIELMQGEIKVTSNLGEGSHFFVNLPLQKAKMPAPKKPLTHVQFDASKLRVLLVEDNLINQKVMTSFLKKFNIEPDIASNGQIAIHNCEQTCYDIIFMDSIMPIMDGLTATKIIAKQNLKAEHTHIIAMTANIDELSKQHLAEVGMVDILPKPIDFMALARILSNCLEQLSLGCNEYTKL
ncbi:hybrid sensor histidine kinase/response regulator [Pseudoalteromonas obscura]|uniref:histidine kinase n=1 Tax=Pseudoalteromonas obscura TaxID=3048491 RepID=A0ABT7EEY8_9GAMM|nr:ATP-binding protein [Pseudoalteromonas sp. P94(2023)]MDK2593847.1 ATP-binding protein [Pseudoalteromonas sp. P94(2023)]